MQRNNEQPPIQQPPMKVICTKCGKRLRVEQGDFGRYYIGRCPDHFDADVAIIPSDIKDKTLDRLRSMLERD